MDEAAFPKDEGACPREEVALPIMESDLLVSRGVAHLVWVEQVEGVMLPCLWLELYTLSHGLDPTGAITLQERDRREEFRRRPEQGRGRWGHSFHPLHR